MSDMTVAQQAAALSAIQLPAITPTPADLQQLGAQVQNILGDTQSSGEMQQIIAAAGQAVEAVGMALNTFKQKADEVAQRLMAA
jgi:hypothetical protein